MIRTRKPFARPKEQDKSNILKKLLDTGRTTGKLNLSSQNVKELPTQLFGERDFSDRDVSFDNNATGWWEQVDLTRLIAADNQIEFLDRRIGELKGLAVLDVHNNQLKSLPLEFQELENLGLLNISMNLLSEFPASICYLPLVELLLGSNEITRIPPEIRYLKKLSKLDLSHNRITELPSEFAELVSLQELNLSNNSIRSIDCDLNQMHQLKVLNLANNQLTSIELDSLKLPRLSILDLKYNQLTKWNLLLDCPSLKDFCLAFNKISSFRDGSVSKCLELEIFDIRDNGIGAVPGDVLKLYQLKRLDISNNAVSSLPPELSLLKQLNALHYTGNPLRGLPTSGGLTKLLDFLSKKLVIPAEVTADQVKQQPVTVGNSKLIDWSGMGLLVLDLSKLSDSGVKPTSLNVSNNAIKEIPEELNQVGSALQTLLFAKNRLSVFPLLSCMHLTTLDLSNNQITNFLADIPTLPVLNELNLNGNRISKLPRLPFPKLSVLLLSSNSLTDLDMSVLEQLPELQILDLSNNSIGMVPPTLGLLKLTSLQLMGNPFRIPRAAILQKGTQATLDYLISRIPT